MTKHNPEKISSPKLPQAIMMVGRRFPDVNVKIYVTLEDGIGTLHAERLDTNEVFSIGIGQASLKERRGK